MAINNYYSQNYALAAFRGAPAFLPKSAPQVKEGGLIAFFLTATTTAALGVGDLLHFIPNVVAGSFLHDLILANDDLDTGTTLQFGLGWTSAPTTYLSASTQLQAASTGVALTAAQLMGGAASAAGDELLITVSAAGTTNVGNVKMMGSLFVP